jgi:hypothetical protein
MEVGLIIQGNPLWDFLESASSSCVLRSADLFASKAISASEDMGHAIGSYGWRRNGIFPSPNKPSICKLHS